MKYLIFTTHYIVKANASFIYLNAQFAKYVGKSETPFHIRLKNHRKDIKVSSSIPTSKNFNSPNHDFNTYGKFTITEQFRSITSSSTEILEERL